MDYDLEFFLVAATFLAGLIVFWARAKASSRHGWLMTKTIDIARSLFPILLIVLVIRSFIIEPFRIPSGSMLPTLEIGDFIMVNKFTYGLKLPVFHTMLIATSTPERGDVVVFRYPDDPTKDYIKRIIGLPGDRIAYKDKLVYINDIPAAQMTNARDKQPYSNLYGRELFRKTEYLGVRKHEILLADSLRGRRGREWQVPEDSYFVMGDNRDNSNDSRAWGFVPAANLVGKAFFIWMNWNHYEGEVKLSRIGSAIH